MGRVSPGRALGQGVLATVRNAPAFLVLAAVVYAPLALYRVWLLDRIEHWDGSRGRGSLLFLLGLGGMLEYLLPLLVQACVAFGVFRQLRGDPASAFRTVGMGIRRLLPVLGVALFLMLIYLFLALPAVLSGSRGLYYLCVAAIAYLACRFYVAVPAAVVEGRGPLRAIARSDLLTQGNRLRVFAILLVVGGSSWLGAYLLQTSMSHQTFAQLRRLQLLQIALSAVFAIWQGTTAAVAYHDLRRTTEGASTEDIAAVFD